MAAPTTRLAKQAEAGAAAVDTALTLHSRSSSTKKIYLDFDGFTLPAGAAWAANGIPAGAYAGFSLDGLDSPGFTQEELDYITTVWTIVSEKYSPFDVDVTTETQTDNALERTTSGDTAYGTHVVFTDEDARPAGSPCTAAGCAGIAWVGVFNVASATLNKYEPAWVFTTLNFGSGDVQQTEGQAANSAAHEIGHTLGLDHDTTTGNPGGYYGGHDVWSPIMGSSNRAVQQFNNLGYDNALTADCQEDPPARIPSDPCTTPVNPDDLDVITKSGISYRPDTEDAALGTHPSYVVDGVITTDADTDTFTINRSACTGSLTATATGIGMGQAVDLKLTVTGPGTNVSDSPTTGQVTGTLPYIPSGMNATVNVPSAAAGTWTIKVEGVGDATSGYTGYGSIGQYHLTVGGCPNGPPLAPKIGTPSSGATGGAVNAVARWAAPTSTGGSTITGYRVIAYKSTISGSVISATVSKLLPATARSYTFALPAARYKFRVVAYNAVGRSPYSAYSTLVFAR